MKVIGRCVIMLCCILAFAAEIDAQKKKPIGEMEISGVITDQSGNPVPGAVVVQKDNEVRGTVTDEMGRYTVKMPSNATLHVSFMGFESVEQKLSADKTTYDIVLPDEAKEISEVVVIGYGEIKKSDLTGSVSTIGSRHFSDQPVKSVSEILQGRTSGVEVTTVSGMPGASAKVRVRGTTSINKSSDPLYVIDGIISSSGLDGLNPQDIMSMEVLKDASSTAVYGSRGANGVILITTRKGERGRAVIVADSKIGLSTLRKDYDLLSAYEYALALNDIRGAGTVTSDDLEKYRTGEKGIDWVDLMTQTGVTQNYNLSVSGGSERVRYLVSGSILDQEAVTINAKYMRYGVRANVDADVREWLSLSMKVNGAIIHSKNGAPSWFHILNFSPTMELKDPETGIYYTDPHNIGGASSPYALLTENKSDSYSYNFNGNFSARFKIIEGLNLTIQGGYNFDHSPSYSFSSSKVSASAKSSMSNSSSLHRYWQNTNNLSYSGEFAGHSVSANAIWEMSRTVSTSMGISGSRLNNESVGYWNVSNAAVRDNSNSYSETSLMSGVVRVNYDYNKRYFLTAALRADGSSKFQDAHRWGSFPSVAVAWDAANESFLKDNALIDQLKVRASYGETGNEAISAYSTLGMLSSTSYGWGTSTNYTGYWGNTFATPDLSWEKTKQFDIGLDLSIKGFDISIDWFNKDTEDLLFQKQVPYYNGGGTFWVNQGELNNKGFEFSLNTFPIDGKVTWETTLNASYLKNEVVDLAGNDFVLTANYSDLGGPMQIMKPGYALGSFYVYEWQGFDETGANLYRKADGSLTTNPTSSDLVIKGHASPTWTFGWNNTVTWKNLTLNLFFNAAVDYDRLNISRYTTASMSGGSRFITLRDSYFKGWDYVSDKSQAEYASLTNSNNKGYANSDFWLEDASFLKLKNVTLSYQIPRYRTRFADIHLSVSAQDVFTITNYSGLDPEVYSSYDGLDYGAYPVPRTVTFGVKLTF